MPPPHLESSPAGRPLCCHGAAFMPGMPGEKSLRPVRRWRACGNCLTKRPSPSATSAVRPRTRPLRRPLPFLQRLSTKSPSEPADRPLGATLSGSSSGRGSLSSEATPRRVKAQPRVSSTSKQPATLAKTARTSTHETRVAGAPASRAGKPAVKTYAAPLKAARQAKPRQKNPSTKTGSAPSLANRKAGTSPMATAGKEPLKASRQTVKRAAPSEARKSVSFRGALAACLVEAPRGRSAANPSPAKKKPPVKVTSLQASKAGSHKSQHETVHQAAGKRNLSAESLAKKTASRKPVESIARTISVNLRLSQAEHDRMSRGAVEADLTLAAFIRESTLRFQVSRQREKQALLEAGFNSPAHLLSITEDESGESYDRPIVEPAGPSLLARVKNFWLGRRLTAIA